MKTLDLRGDECLSERMFPYTRNPHLDRFVSFSSRMIRPTVLAGGAAALLFSGCAEIDEDREETIGAVPDSKEEVVVDLETVGLVPNSHFVWHADLYDISKSPVMQVLEDGFTDMADLIGEDLREKEEEFMELTGIEADQWGSLLLSASFENVDFEEVMEAWDPFEKLIEDLDFLWSVTFRKPLTDETMELLANPETLELYDIEETSESEHRGETLTRVRFGYPTEPDFYFALLQDRRIFVFSPREDLLVNAVDRFLDQNPAIQPEATLAQMQRVENHPFRTSMTLPVRALETIREEIARDMEVNPMAATILQPFLEWTGFSIGLDFDQEIEALLINHFETGESASGFAQTLNNFLPMALMGMQAEGLDLGANPMDHLRIESVGETVEVGFSVTGEGVLQFVEETFQGFQEVQEESREAAMKNNLRQISAASMQYYLEQNATEVDVSELVGPGKFINRIHHVANETYGSVSEGEATSGIAPDAEGLFPEGEWIIREGDEIFASDPEAGIEVRFSF